MTVEAAAASTTTEVTYIGCANISDINAEATKVATTGASASGTDAMWQPCNICLEELCQTDLRTHLGCDDCVLCENCIEVSNLLKFLHYMSLQFYL